MNLVSVETLKGVANPLTDDPWGCGEITEAMIAEAIDSNDLLAIIHDSTNTWSREQHVARIAFIAVNGFYEAIQIDVGIPGMGFNMHWIITDGNHRLAAAIYKNQKRIRAEISGDVSYAKELLGVKI